MVSISLFARQLRKPRFLFGRKGRRGLAVPQAQNQETGPHQQHQDRRAPQGGVGGRDGRLEQGELAVAGDQEVADLLVRPAGGDLLADHLAQIAGFISVERFASQSKDGRFVAIGYFENEKAVAEWRNLKAHRRAQALGRSRFFTSYRLVMAQALRDYSHERRDQAPQDSKSQIGNDNV